MALLLIFDGGSGRLTCERFNDTEAIIFANIAKEMGVSVEYIFTEIIFINMGEDVMWTHKMLLE